MVRRWFRSGSCCFSGRRASLRILAVRRNRAPMAVLEPQPGVREDIAAGIVWAKFLDENIGRFARTVGVPIGDRLGCGLWGCVFETTPPWVVKFTRDSTEGPIWAYMAELLLDPEISSELDAFLRVRDIVRIRPDVLFQGEEMPVYGIVREEALPVVYEPYLATDETLRRLGMTHAMLERAGLPTERPSLNDISDALRKFPPPVRSACHELFAVLLALMEYRKHALVYHQWRGALMRGDYQGLGREEVEDISDAAFREMLGTIELMRGDGDFVNRFGDDIGRTLLASVNFGDLVFRDLHLGNVGWRVHERIGDDRRPKTMVILDPGAMATPYSPEIQEVDLVANITRALERARA